MIDEDYVNELLLLEEQAGGVFATKKKSKPMNTKDELKLKEDTDKSPLALPTAPKVIPNKATSPP